ncbi:galactoside O-acetyltransferase/maltose O-acetyltransferase [Orbus hercynius]|uniref:Acetyltransferase n=1 Tax=Orbus hercynius TaxID=593135 RepID=A0A495RIU5_9GAMM|nr:sugar O-acetyltransferase [Orbus hercynius]RKS87269.1 galactoside O-acetyltransferase/maltose O-acetyltransferase [Orbus hercynius]
MPTEKQKMLAGELYNAATANELCNERYCAQNYCFEFNQLSPGHTAERLAILQKLLNRVGQDAMIMPGFWCDYGYNITLGDHFFANFNCVMLDAAPIQFGNHVFIGPNCGFYTSGHPLDIKSRNMGLEYAKPITVGNNVWIGGNVAVLPGVCIGDNCVIAAGSVITQSISDDAIVMGNPGKIKRILTEL